MQLIGKIKKDPDECLLIALVFVLPFERIPSFEAFGITFRLSLLFAGLIILRFLYLLLSQRQHIKLFAPHKVLIFFIIWIFIMVPQSIDLKRGMMVAVFNAFTILTAISVSFIFEKRYIKPIISTLFASSIIAAIFGLYQYPADLMGIKPAFTGLLERYRFMVFGYPRVQAFSYEPLYFAAYLMLPISAVVSLLLFDKKGLFSAKLLYILLVIYSLAIFLTSSRGGIYSIVVLLAVMLFIAIINKQFNIKKTVFILGTIIFAFLASYLIITNFNEQSLKGTKNTPAASANYAKQVTATSLEKEDERATYRKLAIEILKIDKTAWLIGIGPGQYDPFLKKNLFFKGSDRLIVNNLTLEILVELGAVGLSLLVSFFVLILLGLFKVIRIINESEIRIFAVTLFCYLICQAFQYQSYSTLYIVIIWLTIGMALALLRIYKSTDK